MDFGFTNDSQRFAAVVAWRDAAASDGWSMRQTYEGGESAERAATLLRAGFKAIVLTRDNGDDHRANGKNYHYEADISVWGPDGLAIEPPMPYDFQRIAAGLRRCRFCKRDDVETERVGFAGRCCADCLPAARERIEVPGWAN